MGGKESSIILKIEQLLTRCVIFIINHEKERFFWKKRIKDIFYRKPRICINARDLAATSKKLPCHMDSVESIIPYLNKDSRAIISDDSSGFLHVFLSPESQAMVGIHCGTEEYHFQGMPFGIHTAPAVYQSLNGVISTILRQFRIPNALYIGK